MNTPAGNPIREPDPTHGPACFAPPLTADLIAEYRARAKAADPAVREAVVRLADLAGYFQQTPASKLPGVPLRSVHYQGPLLTPLEPEEIDRIWNFVPWDHELDALGNLFEHVADKPLRDAAYHLLWYARELALDREPMTQDRV